MEFKSFDEFISHYYPKKRAIKNEAQVTSSSELESHFSGARITDSARKKIRAQINSVNKR